MGGNEDGKIEVSVGGVIMLAAATLLATGIVFLLGIYVGKGIAEERLAAEQRVVRLPAPPPPDEDAEHEALSFWDRLNAEEDRGAAASRPEPTPTESSVRVAPPPAPSPTAAPPPPPTPTMKPTPQPRPTTPPALHGKFQVQVQALADRAAAERIARDLEGRGYQSHLSPAKAGDRTLYRVRVGPFATEDEARRAIARLKTEGYPDAFLAAGVD